MKAVLAADEPVHAEPPNRRRGAAHNTASHRARALIQLVSDKSIAEAPPNLRVVSVVRRAVVRTDADAVCNEQINTDWRDAARFPN
jgi:hypothetical protein